MGIANSQRLLNYIRIITEFISQSEYQNLIPMFGIINEAYVHEIGKDQLTSLSVTISYSDLLDILMGRSSLGQLFGSS